MPFVSRLKKLGTLPVTELATTLTVHLINLENSKDANIVYTSSQAILPDATLPSSVCWDSPEIRSKAGDVVIWAPRFRRKACHVQTCWVFDGNAWITAVSDTEVKMDHPTNSRYQLVVLSGPYVKWEIKRDLKSKGPRRTSKKSSSTQPSKVTTHSGGSGLSLIDADGASSSRATPSLPRNSSVTNATPDGSAGFISSPNSPLSDIPDDTASVSSQRSNRESSAVPQSTSTPQATPKQRPSTSREKPKGARPSPTRKSSTNSPVTPLSTPPHITASLLDYGSLSPDQPVKPSALRKRSRVNKRPQSPASPPGPTAKRRKLDTEPHSSTTSIPATSIPKEEQTVTVMGSAHSLMTDNVREAQSQPDWPPPSLQPGAGSSLSFSVETNDYPTGVPNVTTSTFNLEPFSSGIDLVDTANPNIRQLRDNPQRPLDELKRLGSELRSSREETEQCRNDMRRAQDRFESFLKTVSEADVQKQSKIEALTKERDGIAKSFQSLKSQADRHAIQQREHTEVPQATSSAMSEEARRQLEAKIAHLTTQRDDFALLFRDVKERSEVESRAIHVRLDRATEAARRFAEREAYYSSRLAPIMSERDVLLNQVQQTTASEEAKSKQVEELIRKMETVTRRADSFESSLKVAQEALFRQRTLAQESEERQRATITQLANEIKEKDQDINKLRNSDESKGKAIKELEAVVLKGEVVVLEKIDTARRALEELEQLRRSTAADHTMLDHLRESLSSTEDNLNNAKLEVERQASTLVELSKHKSSASLLSRETELRQAAERQADELQNNVTALQQAKREAENQWSAERAARSDLDALFTTETKRLQEIIASGFAERDRLNEELDEIKDQLAIKDSLMCDITTQNAALNAQYEDTIGGFDRECKGLEQLLVQSTASFSQSISLKEAELQSNQAELEALKDECGRAQAKLSEQAELANAGLSSLEGALESVQSQLAAKIKELEDARSTWQSTFTVETGKLKNDLASARTSAERTKLALRQQIDGLGAKITQLEKQLSEMSTMVDEHSRNLAVKDAELKTVKTQFQQEHDRFSAELSDVTQRFEQRLADLGQQMDTVRAQRQALQEKLAEERSTYQEKLSKVDDMRRKVQSDAIQQIQACQAERDCLSSDLGSIRKEKANLEHRLNSEKEAWKEHEEVLANKIKTRTEQLTYEISFHKAEKDALSTKVSILEKQISDIQAAMKQQKLSFENERGNFSTERAGLQQELSTLQKRATDLETQQVSLEAEIIGKSEDIARKSAALAKFTVELSAEREKAVQRTSDQVALETNLQETCAELLGARDRIKVLENEMSQLRVSTEAEVKAAKSEAAPCSHGPSVSNNGVASTDLTTENDEKLKERVIALQATLKRERASRRALQEKVSKEKSTDELNDLASQLLKSLHEAQDKLRAERTARELMTEQMAALGRSTTVAANKSNIFESPSGV